MDDLLIRGGHVIDGTGAPGRDADVSIGAGDGRMDPVMAGRSYNDGC